MLVICVIIYDSNVTRNSHLDYYLAKNIRACDTREWMLAFTSDVKLHSIHVERK